MRIQSSIADLHFKGGKMYREADVLRKTPRKTRLTPRHKSVLGLFFCQGKQSISCRNKM